MTRSHSILVTGSDGYIANALIALLAQRGHEVVALTRSGHPRVEIEPKPKGVRYCTQPLSRLTEDRRAFAEVAARASVALHLAWGSQIRGLTDDENRNRARLDIELGRRFADLCQECGIRHLVFSSSAGAIYSGAMPATGYDETCVPMPATVYGKAKLAVEKELTERFLNHATDADGCFHILRISTPYGPGFRRNRNVGVINNFVEAALEGRPLKIFGAGNNQRDFVYIDDLVEMIGRFINALPDSTSMWNIGANQTASVNEVVEIVENLTGRSLPKTHLNVDAGSGNVRIDASKFHRAYQFSPQYSLRRGIEALMESMANRSEVLPQYGLP